MPSIKNASAKQVDKFRPMARFVMAHHFGSDRGRLKYKTGGLSNFVFEAKNSEGEFIVRISPDKSHLDSFIKEHWCERAARRAGVPTAEILETGFSIIPFPYVISRSVEGVNGIEHPERDKVFRELGRYANKINSIRTRGFGETFDWSNNQLSRNKTLKEYLEGEYGYEARIETLDRSGLCSPPTIKEVKRICRDMLKIKSRPALNHGDLRLKNVIADNSGKILAIIDWEKSTSNLAPHWDLSIAFHDLGIDEKQHFIEGYGITPKRLADIAPYIKTFNLLNYTDKIHELVAAKNRSALSQLQLRLSGTFDLYTF